MHTAFLLSSYIHTHMRCTHMLTYAYIHTHTPFVSDSNMGPPRGWSTLYFTTLLCVAALPWTAGQPEVITACSATFNHSCNGESCNYNGYYEVQDDDFVFFTISARTDLNTWVGIGFSEDQSMVSISPSSSNLP